MVNEKQINNQKNHIQQKKETQAWMIGFRTVPPCDFEVVVVDSSLPEEKYGGAIIKTHLCICLVCGASSVGASTVLRLPLQCLSSLQS
ncbi:hypothetical protein CEXT_10471 [Caerostris extrusa]|uniref:Uncharacterized protein n=1 Tax=Caerostris extrusa TaxID=172846 RepID=A0AAV4MCH7_CAEEX|nr:hypothetical protein CEXT_10471 [Caerostris extrusa]